MKLPLLILSILLLLMSAAHGAAEEAEAGLRALLNDFLAGASVNDAAMHDRFWAEELVYTSSAGARFGKAEIMAGLAVAADAGGAEAGPSYSAREVRVQVFGETAVITFQLVAEQAGAPPELFYNTGVFRVIEGRWQALVWQATRAVE